MHKKQPEYDTEHSGTAGTLSTDRALMFEIDDVDYCGGLDPHAPSPASIPNATYFYQSADGELVFMHSISFKPLLAMHSKPNLLPTEITAPVLDVETIKVTHSTRQKLPFMQHLPLQCSIVVVELDLTNLVSTEVYYTYLILIHICL